MIGPDDEIIIHDINTEKNVFFYLFFIILECW